MDSASRDGRRRRAPPSAEEALRLRLSRLLDPRRLRTSEHTFLLVLAGLVGVYGGLAAGLFSTTISVLRILCFRSEEAGAFLRGEPHIWQRFESQLARTNWRPGLLALGLALALCAVAYGLVLRGRSKGPWGTRLVTVATLSGVGLVLYYSVLFLGAVDRTFLHVEGGLLELVSEAPWWLVLTIPALGGLAVGLLVERFSPESRGHGVSEVLEAMALHHSRIPAKTAVFKGLTAALTIASGGSVGREGPVVQIGSAVGSSIGRSLGVSHTQLRTLVGCGAAAGIAASFDAPIAGAMFALEIILADFGVATFSPIVLSSVLATVMTRALLAQAQLASGDMVAAAATSGKSREIVQVAYELVSAFEIGPYFVLGLLCGVISIVFIASLDRAESYFQGQWGPLVGKRLARVPVWSRPAIGGLLVGCIGLVVPHAMGTGYETMNATLHGQLGVGLVLSILVAKIAATSITLGSGGSGGSFFPAVFIGAMAGSAFGQVVHEWFPTMTATSGAYALVGMGAAVAGCTLGPLTGIIMMFELSGDYQIILPLMVACLSASGLVHRWLGHSIYTLKLAHKGIDPQAGQARDLLRRIPVHDAMTPAVQVIPRDLPFRELLDRLSSSPHTSFVVVDESGHYVGMISLHDVRGVLFEQGLHDLVVAGEVARTDVQPLEEDADLQAALERILTVDVDDVPVVSKDDPTKLVGVLSRRDILLAYRRTPAST